MSADNVMQFPPSGHSPKPKRRKRPRVGLEFAEAEGRESSSLNVFMGLRGVCYALDELGGTTADVNRYVQLSAAAAVLAGILEEREL